MTPQRRAVERLSVKFGITVALLALVFFLAPVLWKYLSPFIIALPFASMIQPVSRFLEKKLRLKRSPAVMIPVLLLLLLLLTAFIWFFSYGMQRVGDVIQDPETLVSGIVGTLRRALDRLIAPFENISGIESAIDKALQKLADWGTDIAGQLLSYVLTALANAATGVPYALIYINFLFMGMYFIAKDYDSLLSFLPHRKKSLTNSGAAKVTSSAISGSIGYLRVQLIYGLITFAVGAVYWIAFQNPYALIIAILTGFLECIPMIGHGLFYLPWALVELILGNFSAALQPFVVHLFLYLLRRFTEPRLMSQNIGLSPLLSVVSMFIGIKAGGIWGLFLGPVVMTVLVAFIRTGVLVPVRSDILLLYHSVRGRWSDSNLTPTPVGASPDGADEEAAAPQEEAAPAGEKPDPPEPSG